ncbi:MAG: GTP-binding protein Era [Rhodospirillaceae bacterium]|nr:MAG: GTP-binding protein Era [Rhodospirillaceae bacterium]
MVQAAWEGTVGADEIVLVVDARAGMTNEVLALVAALQGRQAVLVFNKIDLIQPERLLELTERMNTRGAFTEAFMVSAQTGDGVVDLVTLLARRAPVGPWLFPEEEISDMPMRLLAAEITREKIFFQLHQELPYSTMVLTDGWEERDDGSVRIDQTIIVLRKNQRGIVLGKGGSRIKSIGWAARQELEGAFERRVHLFLHVQVDEHWLEDRGYYRAWLLDFEA